MNERRFRLGRDIRATLIHTGTRRELTDEILESGTLVEILGPGENAYDGTRSTLFLAWQPETDAGPYLYRTWDRLAEADR